MKATVLVLALYAGFSPALALATPVIEARDAFLYACEALKRDCSHVNPPRVQYADLSEFGWLGVFNDHNPGVITLERTIPVERRDEVIVHETTHYVDYHTGMTIGSPLCVAEAVAFHVSNLYAAENGGKPRWDWFVQYGCPSLTIIIQ